MNSCLELEISLSRHYRGKYAAQVRVNDPQAQFLRAPERGVIRLHEDELLNKANNPAAYGQQLFDDLFAPENVQRLYDEVRAIAQKENRPLRLRLFIERDAPELHDWRWETLNDPRPGGGSLLTNERILFSRFLSSNSWEAAPLRAEGDLRALVVIANPGNLADPQINLTPVDVPQESQRAQAGLGDLFKAEHVLASDPKQPGRVTLDALNQQLRQGFDILYLVCHGALITKGELAGPQLLLEKQDGAVEIVPGVRLAEFIRDLSPELRPRLIVLASCQSAGAGGPGPTTADAQGALAALGPLLAQAGVPAVLAMQGSVAMKTVADFMPLFFQNLRQDGQIDRAMAVARAAVSQRADAWMPVLYLRLRDGSLWYTPSFGGDNPELIWGRLLAGIEDQGRCTPILGPGLSEYLSGALRQVARHWAEQEHYPLSEHGREELPQVAQYLANRDGPGSPRRSLIKHFRKQIDAKFAQGLPAGLQGATDEETLALQMAEIARLRMQQAQVDPCALIAKLPFPIYITTNPDNLLVQALKEAGKAPVVDYARWNSGLQNLQNYPSEYETARAQNYEPSVKRPFVYHLFGMLRERDSLILSEDDHFDYLMWVNQSNPAPLPVPIGKAISTNGLLFLGFGILDWNFRLLFRSILTEQRRKTPRNYWSVAVQVRPGEDILNPEQARQYMEQYLAGVNIGVYWGSVDEFMRELWDRAQKRGLV
jgi:hypothetical protein